MQGAGGPGSIARLLFEAGARPRTKLRSGQIVRANVIKQIAPSKWMLGIGGRVIPAFSERALSSGMTFLAQVRIEGGTVLLQPYQEVGGGEGAARFLSAEGLPRDELSVTIVRALLRSGMPLDPARIARAHAFFRNRDSFSSRAVRAYLLLQEKGLEPSQEGLDRFLDALHGFGGRDHGERGDQRRGRERHRRRDSGTEAVREMVTRRNEEPDDLIHAFNHLASDRGHWIVVPFAVSGAAGSEHEGLIDTGAEYRGSIRIHFSGERPRFDRAAVSVEGAGGTWQFELVPATGAGATASARGQADRASFVRVFSPEGREPPEALLGELRERMAALGMGRVEVESGENFDGFSTDESLDILKGIDTEA
jgi:hypothetical protein